MYCSVKLISRDKVVKFGGIMIFSLTSQYGIKYLTKTKQLALCTVVNPKVIEVELNFDLLTGVS